MSSKCVRCHGSGVEPERAVELFVAGDEIPLRPAPSAWWVEAAFDEFWELYERTGPRKKAHECFVAAVRRGHTFEQIIEGLRAWVWYWAQPGSASRKWPQGFLNQEYYLDEPPAVRVETSRKAMPGRGGIEAALAARSQQRGIGSGS